MSGLTDAQTGYAVAAVCVLALALLIVAAAAAARGRRVPAGTYATFAPVPSAEPEPTVWLACHNIACAAHMTTRHIPHDDGTATCQACGQNRLDHQ